MTTPVKQKALDRIDISILDALQRDGRIANVDLARKVNLSASPCIDRVKRLEKEGYIEGYGAWLNASKLGLGTAAFIQVTLDRTTSEVFDKFREAVVQIPQVAECHMVAGGFDYLLKLRLPNMDAYRSILSLIVDLPGVAQTHTYVVIEQVKNDKGLPLKQQAELSVTPAQG
ncbi:Lrp/AsnC ligand binding domain-containing protein [Chromatiaceae bacterium AAb-1]|nr:Lrp/AsnC ligand binding domain-containing protein [Chromatiaceae bacterium AAb-1]